MFTLLRVSKARANKGIYHTRRNGDLVQKLTKDNATLVYEVTDEHSDYFGEKYAFFIIECDEFDYLECGNSSKSVTNCRSEQEIYYDAVYVSQMCEQLIKQQRPLPDKLENLLSEYLPRFFSKVIQWEAKECDSAATWQYYEWILKYLGKTANDFVKQTIIDNFFKELCSIHDVYQISRILPSEVITISNGIPEAIEESKKEVQETIEIAKKLIAENNFEDIVGYMTVVSMYAKDTPCGNIGVHIHRVNREHDLSVILAMDNNCAHTTCKLRITDECKEFKEMLKRKL